MYNVEKYIEECVVSVLSQITSEVELIVADDGSTDNSLTILKTLQKGNKFSLYKQENSGVSVARNLGLLKAKGEYVVFLDSDDYWRKDAVSILLEAIKTYDVGLIRFDEESFVEKGLEIPYKPVNYILKDRLKSYTIYSENRLEAIFGEFNASPCLYAVKRKVLEENRIRFKEGIIHEDQLFTTQVFLTSNDVVYVPESLYFRRYRPNSITTDRSLEQLTYAYVSKMGIILEFEELLKNPNLEQYKKEFLLSRIKVLYNTSQDYPIGMAKCLRYVRRVRGLSLRYKVFQELKRFIKMVLFRKVM